MFHRENQFKLETVRVKSDTAPGGHVVINKSDFDPAVHVEHVDTVESPVSNAGA